MNGWIGVDLDGTLAQYDGWKGPDNIGDPIPLMVGRVKEWLEAGHEVRVFTARVSHDGTAHREAGGITKTNLEDCRFIARARTGYPAALREIERLQARIERARESAKEIEQHCPCGARPESLHTHPHVLTCPVEKVIAILEGRNA